MLINWSFIIRTGQQLRGLLLEEKKNIFNTFTDGERQWPSTTTTKGQGANAVCSLPMYRGTMNLLNDVFSFCRATLSDRIHFGWINGGGIILSLM